MTARKRLCCAAAAGLGECSEPRREDSYFCESHDRERAERHPKRPLWTLEPPGEGASAA